MIMKLKMCKMIMYYNGFIILIFLFMYKLYFKFVDENNMILAI